MGVDIDQLFNIATSRSIACSGLGHAYTPGGGLTRACSDNGACLKHRLSYVCCLALPAVDWPDRFSHDYRGPSNYLHLCRLAPKGIRFHTIATDPYPLLCKEPCHGWRCLQKRTSS